jgi:hypothetical protein
MKLNDRLLEAIFYNLDLEPGALVSPGVFFIFYIESSLLRQKMVPSRIFGRP